MTTRHRNYRWLFVALAIVLGGGSVVGQVSAQADAFAASIVSGDCASETVVADLTGLELPTGAQIGAASGRTAASSYTAVPISFDQLTASPHAVQASQSCGAIGGAVNAAGALIIVLSGEAGDNGIAYLSPSATDPTQTDVSIFLAPSSTARDQAEAAESPATDDSDPNAAGPADAETPEPTPTPAPLGLSEGSPAPIGTPLENEGLVVTVLNAYYAGGFGLSTPKGGYTYLVLDVQLQNNGDRSRSYGESSFSGHDADTDVGYDSVFVVADGTLGSGSLDPGAFATGAVILEVQQTAQRVRITYDPAVFDPNDLYWSFGY